MNRPIAGLLLLSLLPACKGTGSPDATPSSAVTPVVAVESSDRSLWADPELRRQILEGMVSESELEPKVTTLERDALAKVFDLMAGDQLDAAATEAAKLRGPTASAVVDYTCGSLCFQRDQLDAAAEAYLAAIEKFPRFLRAWRFLGRVRMRQSRFAEAVPALTKVIELGGADALTWGLLGFAYASLEDHLASESAYRMAGILDPRTQDWKMGLARSLFKQRRFADAIALFDSMLAAQPERHDLWLLQADCWLGLDQPRKAAQNFEIVAGMGKATAASLLTLADIYVNDGLYDLGARNYLAAMERDPALDVGRPLRAARVLAARGVHEESRQLVARIEATRAADLTGEQQKDLLRLRARLAAADGATDEEARVLEEIVQLDPLDGDALIMLGDHSKRGGDLERAVFWYERASSLEAFEAEAKLRHGQLLVGQGRYAEALPMLRRSQALKPREKLEEHIAQIERANQTRT
jgi:tetratricopeptide (TPR) repeat protein